MVRNNSLIRTRNLASLDGGKLEDVWHSPRTLEGNKWLVKCWSCLFGRSAVTHLIYAVSYKAPCMLRPLSHEQKALGLLNFIMHRNQWIMQVWPTCIYSSLQWNDEDAVGHRFSRPHAMYGAQWSGCLELPSGDRRDPWLHAGATQLPSSV